MVNTWERVQKIVGTADRRIPVGQEIVKQIAVFIYDPERKYDNPEELTKADRHTLVEGQLQPQLKSALLAVVRREARNYSKACFGKGGQTGSEAGSGLQSPVVAAETFIENIGEAVVQLCEFIIEHTLRDVSVINAKIQERYGNGQTVVRPQPVDSISMLQGMYPPITDEITAVKNLASDPRAWGRDMFLIYRLAEVGFEVFMEIMKSYGNFHEFHDVFIGTVKRIDVAVKRTEEAKLLFEERNWLLSQRRKKESEIEKKYAEDDKKAEEAAKKKAEEAKRAAEEKAAKEKAKKEEEDKKKNDKKKEDGKNDKKDGDKKEAEKKEAEKKEAEKKEAEARLSLDMTLDAFKPKRKSPQDVVRAMKDDDFFVSARKEGQEDPSERKEDVSAEFFGGKDDRFARCGPSRFVWSNSNITDPDITKTLKPYSNDLRQAGQVHHRMYLASAHVIKCYMHRLEQGQHEIGLASSEAGGASSVVAGTPVTIPSSVNSRLFRHTNADGQEKPNVFNSRVGSSIVQATIVGHSTASSSSAVARNSSARPSGAVAAQDKSDGTRPVMSAVTAVQEITQKKKVTVLDVNKMRSDAHALLDQLLECESKMIRNIGRVAKHIEIDPSEIGKDRVEAHKKRRQPDPIGQNISRTTESVASLGVKTKGRPFCPKNIPTVPDFLKELPEEKRRKLLNIPEEKLQELLKKEHLKRRREQFDQLQQKEEEALQEQLRKKRKRSPEKEEFLSSKTPKRGEHFCLIQKAAPRTAAELEKLVRDGAVVDSRSASTSCLKSHEEKLHPLFWLDVLKDLKGELLLTQMEDWLKEQSPRPNIPPPTFWNELMNNISTALQTLEPICTSTRYNNCVESLNASGTLGLHVPIPSEWAADPARFQIQLHSPEFQLWILTVIAFFFVAIEYNDRRYVLQPKGEARSIHSLCRRQAQIMPLSQNEEREKLNRIIVHFQRSGQLQISGQVLELKRMVYRIIAKLDPLYARSLYKDICSEEFWVDWKRTDMRDPLACFGEFGHGKDSLRMPKREGFEHVNWIMDNHMLNLATTKYTSSPGNLQEKTRQRHLSFRRNDYDFNDFQARYGHILKSKANTNHALTALMSTENRLSTEKGLEKGKVLSKNSNTTQHDSEKAAEKLEEFIERLIDDETGDSYIEDEQDFARNDKVYMWQVRRLFSKTQVGAYFDKSHKVGDDFLRLVFKYKGKDMEECKRERLAKIAGDGEDGGGGDSDDEVAAFFGTD